MEFNFRFSETASINLDIIRVAAIQNVAVAHGMAMMGLIPPVSPGLFGSISFPLIFLISGILTSYSLLNKQKDKDYDFQQYFLNRVSRIYPSLLLSIVFLIIFDISFIILGGKLTSFNILTLIFNLLFINDSVFGIPNFGSSYNFWTLPNFWWSYLFLGWFLLGSRTVQKKYKYLGILSTFSFLLIAVYLGPWYKISLLADMSLLFIWVSGVLITIILNRYDLIIQNRKKLGRIRIKQDTINKIFLYSFLFIFIFGSICCLSSFNLGPMDIEYQLILVSSVLLLLIYSQYAKFQYKEKFKKVIRFMASYTFTLYIVHFALFNLLTLFLGDINSVILFFIGYILSNLLAILIAYFTEMRYYKINKYLLKKCNLDTI